MNNSYATLWASRIPPASQNMPYPSGLRKAVHNQQPSSPGSPTFDRNLV